MIKDKMRRIDKVIPDGDKGIDETVKFMWALALRDAKHPEIKAIVDENRGNSDAETAKNLFDYVWKNVPYVSDPPGREQVTAPIHLINGNKVGEDCDGMVTLLISLLTAANIDSHVKVIAWRRHDYTHVIAGFKDGSTWYPLDPTGKSSGWKNQLQKEIRSKIYARPQMADVTLLADEATKYDQLPGSNDCGCTKSKKRARNDNDNRIEINIGNSTNADNHASNHNELMKGVSATETSATNFPGMAQTNGNAVNSGVPTVNTNAVPPIPSFPMPDLNGVVTNAIESENKTAPTAKKLTKRYQAWV